MPYRPKGDVQRAVGAELRNDLIRAARALLVGNSPEAQKAGGLRPNELKLRSIAAKAGVSHAAPYLHFPGGLSELVAAVAIQGFEELMLEKPRVDTAEHLGIEAGVAYVRFGVENPGLYRTMFSEVLAGKLASLGSSLKPEDRGYETFWNLYTIKLDVFLVMVAALEPLASAGRLRSGMPHHDAKAVAALVHGLVGEFIDEGLGKHVPGSGPWNSVVEATTRRALNTLFHGIIRE
jgi:AcrR family transcriptional regulator